MLRSAGKGNRRREHSAASLGKYGAAVADPDTYAHAGSIDLFDSVRIAVTDSDVQRDTVAVVATVNSPDIRFSDAVAQCYVLTRISYDEQVRVNLHPPSPSSRQFQTRNHQTRFSNF